MRFQGLDAGKDAIVEGLFTHVVPQVFHRIERWCLRRQNEEPQITGEPDLLTAMPPGPVEHHEDVFLTVAGSDFIRKYLHTGPIHTGQDHRITDTVGW